MKQEQNLQDDLTKKWIKEAGTDYPGDEFQLAIFKKIAEAPANRPIYQPVISPLAWKFIMGYIAVLFASSFLFIPSGSTSQTLFDKIPQINIPGLRFFLFDMMPVLPDLSPQFVLGIAAFFSIGFIMILTTLKSKQASI